MHARIHNDEQLSRAGRGARGQRPACTPVNSTRAESTRHTHDTHAARMRARDSMTCTGSLADRQAEQHGTCSVMTTTTGEGTSTREAIGPMDAWSGSCERSTILHSLHPHHTINTSCPQPTRHTRHTQAPGSDGRRRGRIRRWRRRRSMNA